METKTIRQILSNLPDEVRDMAMLSVILAGGREALDQELCLSCGNNSLEVSALMGSIDICKALGGIDFWTQEIMKLNKDSRILLHVERKQLNYLFFLYEMATTNLKGTLLEPITLTTQKRKDTIQILIEQKQLERLTNLGVKVEYIVKYNHSEIFYN